MGHLWGAVICDAVELCCVKNIFQPCKIQEHPKLQLPIYNVNLYFMCNNLCVVFLSSSDDVQEPNHARVFRYTAHFVRFL